MKIEMPRVTIVRQRRVFQALQAAFGDKTFVKALHAEVREALVGALAEGDGLDTAHAIAPLLLDTTTDAVFGAFDAFLESIESGMTDRVVAPLPAALAKKKAAAQIIRQRVFPRGTGFLTDSMSLQYNAMTKVIALLRDDPEVKAALRELNAEWFVDHMEAHLAPYGRAVKTKDDQDLEAVGSAFHNAFVRLVVRVSVHHESDAEINKRLFASYESELEAQRADDREARKRATDKKKTTEEKK